MHEYQFEVDVKGPGLGEGFPVILTSYDLRQAPAVLPNGLKVTLEAKGLLRCEGVILRDQEAVEVPEGSGVLVSLDVSEIYEKASEDPNRIPGKVCHNCQLWDREEGRRQFSAQTHTYADGSFSRIEEIIKAVSTKNKAQPLTLTVIGYCPVHLKLCAESSIACTDYKARPWLARIKNWWTRQFR